MPLANFSIFCKTLKSVY